MSNFKIDPHANAFPMVCSTTTNEAHYGLSKRELFSILVMQGLLARGQGYDLAPEMATKSIRLADALLAELEKH